MPGASHVHEVILVDCIIELGTRWRGKPCRVASADTALRTSIVSKRRPDVTVDCAAPDGTSYEAHKRTVVIEVLSPTTRRIDLLTKLEGYQRRHSLRHILLVDPDIISAKFYSRPEGGEWSDANLVGGEATVDFSAIEVSLPLGALYERVELSA